MAYFVAIPNICCYLDIKVQNYQTTVKTITGKKRSSSHMKWKFGNEICFTCKCVSTKSAASRTVVFVLFLDMTKCKMISKTLE